MPPNISHENLNQINVDLSAVKSDLAVVKSELAAAKPDLATLKTDMEEVKLALSGVQGTINGVIKACYVAGPILLVLAGYVGWDYKNTKSDLNAEVGMAQGLKGELETVKALRRQYAKASEENIVAKMEAVFNAQTSFDSIGQHNEVRAKLNQLRSDLEGVVGLEQPDKSTYNFIIDALDSYLDKKFDASLKYLDRVAEPDRNCFTYAQMRGACLLRTAKLEDAANWFRKAKKLATESRTAQQAMNATGVSTLYLGRQTQDQDRIREAIGIFKSITLYDKEYPTAYLNAASCYAQLHDYEQVTRQLLESLKHKRTKLELVEAIRNDLDITTEQFLKEYVETYLGVRIRTDNENWADEIQNALDRKAAELKTIPQPS